jgi:flagellar biosynthesis repressor protein FlbT
MALKVELKPGERIIIGTAVLRNGDQRSRFFIDGQAPILREKDILTAESANSPARRIYFAVQLMYLEGDTSRQHDTYFTLIRDFLSAAPSALTHIAEINNRILIGEYYKALKAARDLIQYEQTLMSAAGGA